MTTTTDATGWEMRAGELTASGRAFVGNESVDARSGATFEKRSPVDGRHLAAVAACDAPDVDDAVRAARKAFESGVWAELAPRDRKTILLDYAGRIAAAKEELAVLSTLEMGKPIGDSLYEVDFTVQCIAYYAEAIDKIFGEIGPTAPNSLT